MESKFGNWQSALDMLSQTAKTNNDMAIFKSINNNFDRVNFILEKQYLNLVLWLPTYFANCEQMNRKSKEKSVYHRNAGNKLFQVLKYDAALESYNKSVLYAPVTSLELGLALGNRSAALLHLERFQDCVADIDLALSSSYPAEPCYKLHLRKAQCFGELMRIDDALLELSTADEQLQKNIGHLSRKTSDLAKQNITVLRNKLPDRHACLKKKVGESNDIKQCTPDLSYGINHQIPQASSALKMTYTSKQGRYFVATRDIKPGDTLVVEPPFSAILLPDYYDSHCNHCIAQLTSPPHPCSRCYRVRYCSEKCQKLAWDTYHHIECKYLDLLHSIGIAHLSLRTILVAGSQYLKEFLSSREDSLKEPDMEPCCSSEVYRVNYSSVFNLVSHSDEMEVDDMFQSATTAALLLTVLVRSGWAADSENTEFPPTPSSLKSDNLPAVCYSNDSMLLGAACLLHILQLVCNAHAITALQVSHTSDLHRVDTQSQVRIASAIYPTVSMMNHSCDPMVISSFHKDILVIRAVKSVSAGHEILNCYGPQVKKMRYHERQQSLREQYFFNCECSACMQDTHLERQFETLRCTKCDGMAVKTGECLTCNRCGEVLDVGDYNDRLKTASEFFIEGLSQLQQSQIRGAIRQFQECEKIREALLYRYHKDLAEVEDCLARCYAMIGEFDNAYEHLKISVASIKYRHGEDSIELAYELQKMAEVLFNSNKVTLCKEAIDKALEIFRVNFGDLHSTVRDLIEIKECLEIHSRQTDANKSQMA